MKTYTVTVTENELDNLICGLCAQISSYCCSKEEREPYFILLDKLTELRG